MRRSLIVAAALLAVPAASQAKTLDDLLVEKGVITKDHHTGATNSAASKVFWNNGTRFEFPDNGFTAGFATHLEQRYEFLDNDSDFNQRDVSSFDITKARLIVSGTAMHNEFSYYLQPDFVGGGDSSGSSSANLQDAWISWHACDWADVKMGQYKTFVSRQFNTTDWKRQFPDHSVASSYFNFGRQHGLSGEARFADGAVALKAGIFNGTSNYGDAGVEGQNNPGRDNNHSGFVAVRFNAMGEMDAFEEADVNYTEDMALNFGAAYGFDRSKSALEGSVSERDIHAISADVNLKHRGLSVHGEFFYSFIDPDQVDEDIEPLGFYVQAGYFIMPKKLEIAARYSMVDCDSGQAPGFCTGLDTTDEAGAVVNYYWWKHNLKASIAYTFYNLEPEVAGGEDLRNNAWVFQLSSYF